MRKLIVSAVAALLLAGGASGALANPKEGDNGHQANDYGLCRAYSSGSATGQAHKHQAGPFADLEDRAGGADKVADFCASATPGNK